MSNRMKIKIWTKLQSHYLCWLSKASPSQDTPSPALSPWVWARLVIAVSWWCWTRLAPPQSLSSCALMLAGCGRSCPRAASVWSVSRLMVIKETKQVETENTKLPTDQPPNTWDAKNRRLKMKWEDKKKLKKKRKGSAMQKIKEIYKTK